MMADRMPTISCDMCVLRVMVWECRRREALDQVLWTGLCGFQEQGRDVVASWVGGQGSPMTMRARSR